MTRISYMGVERQNIKIFTEDDIIRITRNYSTPIGKGGFGEVYKGILDDDYHLVAVKRYISEDLREEFMEEVSIHSQLRYKNVVKLIGYCIGESTLTMVTEYISKGNLDDTLHKSDISIPLDIRLGIAIGCAEALSYMHSMHLSSDSLVCHGDIKPANILLDDSLTTKLSDFGLIDYMDPIYLQKGVLTPRSDVYSFGIVLLELITRRRVKEGRFSLIEAFSKAYAKLPELRKLVDAEIAYEENLKVLMEIGKLANDCLSLDINKRPPMNDVAKRLRMLWKVLRGGQDIGWHKKSFGIFKWNAGNTEILTKFSHFRIFTKEELNQVTQNYSCQFSWSAKFYKGTLEDNTVVVVKKIQLPILEANEGLMLLPQITHKNIIKLLGYCLEVDTQFFVYEYASKGSLASILGGQEDLPLDLRVKIAVKIAETLAYLHSSPTGIIKHANVVTSNILLDDKFRPKLTGFSMARRINNAETLNLLHSSRTGIIKHGNVPSSILIDEKFPTKFTGVSRARGLIKENGISPQYSVTSLVSLSKEASDHKVQIVPKQNRRISHRPSEILLEDDPVRLHLLQTVGEDVSSFSIVLSELMRVEQSGNQEDITILNDIRRLALKCNSLQICQKPTMKEVAERLRIIRKSWRERTNKRAK
ncbi:hypothetical protein ACP70R_007544 [Stipagrostis hirtigluma subsp. patula]